MLGGLRRVVRLIVGIIVLIIVAGIVLVLLKANATNTIVSDVHGCGALARRPVRRHFQLPQRKGRAGGQLGIAAVVYVIVGGLIARLLGSRR